MLLMDPDKAKKLKADGHVAATIGKHYKLDSQNGLITRKVFNCWTCGTLCRPQHYKPYSEVEGIKYQIASSYKCTKDSCGKDCHTTYSPPEKAESVSA